MKSYRAPFVTLSVTNKSLALVLAGLLIAFSAQSQTAGNWNMNGTLTGTAGSHISLGTIGLGSSIVSGTFNGGTEYYGEGGWPTGAIDLNAYTEFTLTAGTGYYLVLNNVSLIQRRSSTGSAGAGPNQWSIRSSLDNYASDITSGSMTSSYVTYTITLPVAFQSIPSTVTFRVYGYNTTISSGGTSRFVYDNISVQGQAVSGVLAQQSIDLTAKSAGSGNVSLQWQTEGFAAGTDFTLQRSTNGVDFQPVYQSQSTDNTRFQYQDAVSAAALFYRVAATQPDGAVYLSPIVAFQQQTAKQTRIRGVVAQGSSIKTLLHIEETGAYQLTVWSSDGRALLKQTVAMSAGEPVADLSLGANPHGVYILTLSNEAQQSSRQFVY